MTRTGDEQRWRALERRVCAYVRERGLLRQGERPLLLLSGGPDSMALLALSGVWDCELELGLASAALHVDYGLRGADSDRDRRIVEEACSAKGITLHVVRAPGSLKSADFQRRARDFRYDAARRLAVGRGYTAIVTAHNLDDQAETIVYRLAKYASPAGLVGMRPREGDLVRPLLCLRAPEVRDYCRARGIPFGEDVTNVEPVYARNLVRLEVLPALARLNPRAVEALGAGAEMAADERELLDALAERAWERVATTPAGTTPALDRARLSDEPEALRAACVRRLLRYALGDVALVERRLVAAVSGLSLRPAGGGRVSLGHGWEAVRRGELVTLRRTTPRHECAPVRLKPGAGAGAVGRTGFCGRRFSAELLGGGRFARTTAEAWLGLESPPRRVLLRHPRRGERFSPLGAGGSTTVLQFLADRRLPLEERDRALVVEVDGAVAWVAGRVAESWRVTESRLFTLHIYEEGR